MVESYDTTFAALAHPTRRDILARLALGEATVTDIAAGYAMSLNAVSKHLRVLEGAGLVSRRVEWRAHYLKANPEPLREASAWLDHYRAFWDQKLDALEQFIVRKKEAKHVGRNPPDAAHRRRR